MFDRFGGCKNAYNAEEDATPSSADWGQALDSRDGDGTGRTSL